MTGDGVLVVNVGSSTVKVQVVEPDGVRRVDHELPAGDLDGLLRAVRSVEDVGAVGHRIVHGGSRHVDPEPVTDELLGALEELTVLAPLHLPPELDVVRAVGAARPDLPAVACYDTAFHATIPAAAHLYAVPERWERLGVRRFGFHGLSHRYASHRAADVLEQPVDTQRIVTCHLGSGASLAAVAGGRSVDTTMGFTPLSGVVMATRAGDVDPGAVLWVQRHAGLGPDDAEQDLWHRSGLAGLSRRSGDMREVLAGVEAGDDRCRLALDVYLHRLRAAIASMAAAMGGLDALVFTGGVGERSSEVRRGAVAGLEFLGVRLDPAADRGVAPSADTVVSPTGAAVPVVVVHSREDLEVARQVRRVVV